ncbi:hypothetical protein ACFWIN_34660 [Streptomyces sp. NPDC127049]|uniref:hypothetical protein n=1 Tax=Streptomyces sp. NPDC127049 TaxID=3347118 RepID=UPI0036586D47
MLAYGCGPNTSKLVPHGLPGPRPGGRAPPVRLARLTSHQRDTKTARGQAAYGQNLAFGSLYSLTEYRPAGGTTPTASP